MLPSQLRLGSNFVVRTLIISAIIASLFAAGCGTSYTAQPTPPQAPTITQQPTSQTVAPNGTATFTASANGNPAPTVQWQVSTDSGATFGNVSGATSTTLTLSPVTVALNTYQYRAVFTNSAGSVTSNAATLTVAVAPLITSANSATFAVGMAGTFTVTATGTPVPTLSESGTLPTGVTFDPATGVLSGTPQTGTGAIYSITFTASNGSGADATLSFTLTVDEAPSFTSPSSTNFTVGAFGMFTVTASGFPAPTLSVTTGTPPTGVTFNSSTGALSGTPTATGTFPITFGASNGVGTNATQPFTLTVATGPLTITTVEPFPIFAGTATTMTFNITVANDVPGDVLTAALTVDGNTTFNCTTATCGTLASSTPTFVSLGNYTISYTPPPSPTPPSPPFVQTFPTIMVTSNQAGFIGANDSFEVDPAGILVTTDDSTNGSGEASGINRSATLTQIGSAPKTVTVKVYNDSPGVNAGVTFPPLTGSGYACANIGANTCGIQGTPSAPVFNGTTSTTTITYTPPTSLPSAPYDRPRIQAVSKATPTRTGSIVLPLNSNPVTNLNFNYNTKFKSVLTAPASTVRAQTLIAKLASPGPSKSINWTLTANGAPCVSACGALGTATTTVNVANGVVRSVITYTPPASVPTVTAQVTPTITATSADDAAQNDSFTFTIGDGTCSSTNNGVLKGQYAFLVRGGAAPAGYVALIGSFTADGAGKITGGLIDANTSSFSFLESTILPTGTFTPPFDSTYSVGSDNRGCLTLADSSGGLETFRFSVGKLVTNVATEGRIIRFDDNTWRGRAQSGILMKQDTTSFNAGALIGNYVFGEVGVDSNGGRSASAGLITSNGVSMLSNISGDYDDAGTVGSVTSGTGSYSISTATGAASGRGTARTTTMINAPSGAVTANLVLYMVSSKEALIMSTDLQSTGGQIVSGELKQQTGPFSTAALNGNGFVFYTSGVNPGNAGGNVTAVGQATFTTTAGNATVTIDENNNGTLKPEQHITSAVFNLDATGRMTVMGLGTTPPIIYLIDSNSGFSVGTDNGVPFGYVERQTSSGFQTCSIAGPFFFGGDAPTTGAQYQSGTASFNCPSGGTSSINGKADDSGPNGLKTENISGGYSFSVSSTPPGKGTVGSNSIAYAISVTKIVFMSTGANPEIFVGQR